MYLYSGNNLIWNYSEKKRKRGLKDKKLPFITKV